MSYSLAMGTKCLFLGVGMLLVVAFARQAHADVVEMQNGDRFSGKVLSVSADTVVLDSETLGKINVPRKRVAGLRFGVNAAALKTATNAARVAVPTNLPVVAPAAAANTNGEISALIRLLGANTNLIASVRQQFLAGSPEAAARYDEIVNGLLNGRMRLDDLSRQARSCANQLRELKRDLGPEAGDAIDTYLSVLDTFLKEAAAEPAGAAPAPRPNPPAP
jgi:hypothetical protein